MSITFGGVGSGLPVSDWIDALVAAEQQPITNMYTQQSSLQKSQTTLSSVSSKFSSLRSAIEKLTDANISSSFSLFNKMKASSNDTAIASVSATSAASTQSIKLEVSQLATSTKAKSTSAISKVADVNTKIVDLGDGDCTAGKFTINVDGSANEFTIDSDTTIDSLINNINSYYTGQNKDVIASFTSDGKFKITANSTGTNNVATVTLGNLTDTSNFLYMANLSGAAQQAETQGFSFTSTGTVNTYDTSLAVGKVADGTTGVKSLANGSFEFGTFSLFVNGKRFEFNISDDSEDTTRDLDENATLNDVANLINTKLSDYNITASVTKDGKFEISTVKGADPSKTDVTSFLMGASGDTGNFLNATQLASVSPLNYGNQTIYKSSNPITSVNVGSSLTDNSANLNVAVTAGWITIGNAELEIKEGMSLADLMSKINSNADAGVIAQFDARSNGLTLTSKNPGSTAITMKAGKKDGTGTASNFFSAVKLVDESGNSLKTQELGKNAIVKINDNTIVANSNKLTSDITGMSGVTINITKTTDENDYVSLDVSQDTQQLTDALNDFISKFNSVISEIDKNTGSGGDLKSEYTLNRYRNDYRMLITSNVDELSTFDSLAMIGISTGGVGKSVNDISSTLSLDVDKLSEALLKDPDEVKKLLIGDKAQGITGILQQLESKVEAVLDPEEGYFATRKDSMSKQISAMDKKIADAQERLQAYKERITEQFNKMDQAISQMQSQSSYF